MFSTALASSSRSCFMVKSSYQATARPAAFRPLQHERAKLCQPNRAYTQEAITAIRYAQQEACRAGSMFIAPPHLLLGLLDQPNSSASQLLTSAGVTSETARGELLDPDAMPLSSSMGAGDLHWAPDSRAALSTAAHAAQEAGQAAAGTPHLLLGIITCDNAAVTKVLQQAGTGGSDAAFGQQIREAASSCTETAAQQPTPAEQQAAALVQQYNQYIAKHGTAPPPGQNLGSTPEQVIVMTPEDDDIYN